jgi:anaerobic ribonucleoside-triphosphate reductase activating protein
MLAPAGGLPVDPEERLRRRGGVRYPVEGVTLLGGEPFEQAAALAPFVREVRRRGLTVVVFSGHLLEDLRADRPPGSAALLAEVDLLVDGPFVAALPERERRWAGSANQRFHFLSGRISPGVEWIVPGGPERTVELRFGADGTMERSGWPEG